MSKSNLLDNPVGRYVVGGGFGVDVHDTWLRERDTKERTNSGRGDTSAPELRRHTIADFHPPIDRGALESAGADYLVQSSRQERE